MSTPVGTAIYTRISRDRESEEAGVTRQRTDCEALAERLGYRVVRVLSDNDTGASTRSRKARPAYAALLAAARAGEVGAIIAYSNSRLTRRPREVEDLIELSERYGVRIHTVVSGAADLATADGRMVARILGNADTAEAERIGERVARAALQARAEGRWTGGPRPFGYEADGVTVREIEAEAVRGAYRSLLAGVSLAAIGRAWNDAALFTGRTGRPWAAAGVRETLRSARYAGLRAYRRTEIVGAATWPAIVSEETWRAALALLDDPARRVGVHAAQRLLTGVARCGVCGGPVHCAGSGHGRPIYRCASAAATGHHFARLALPIEATVEATIIARLGRPDALDLLVDRDRPDAQALRDEAATLRARLDTLAVDFADGALTSSQLRAATERLRARLDDVETRQADAGRVDALGPLVKAEDVSAAWGALDTDRRRAVVATLADVVILPVGRGCRTFDPESVQVMWRSL